nr:unnamed protein product [Naegleria fowleri]
MGSCVSSISLTTTHRKTCDNSQCSNKPFLLLHTDAKSSIIGNTLVHHDDSFTSLLRGRKRIPLLNGHKTCSFSAYLQQRVFPPERDQHQLIHSSFVDGDSDSEPKNHNHQTSHNFNHLKYITKRKSSPSTYLSTLESNRSDWYDHSPQRQRSYSFHIRQHFTIKTKKNSPSLVHNPFSKNNIDNIAPSKKVRKGHPKTTRSLPKQKNHWVHQEEEDDDENDQLISQVIDSFRLRKAKHITPKTSDSSSGHSLSKRLSFKYLLQNSSSDRREEFFIVVTPPPPVGLT